MIYIMGQKYLRKNIDKLVRPNRYYIIDSENYGVTANDGEQSITDEFSNSFPIGGLCPETELFRMLKKLKNKEEVNEKKMKRLLDEFFHSDDFIGGACIAAKAQGTYGVDDDINIFVVVPSVVYKTIGNDMAKRFEKIIKTDDEIKFIRTQSWIEDHGGPKKALKRNLKRDELKQILKGIKRAEKKYGLKLKDID